MILPVLIFATVLTAIGCASSREDNTDDEDTSADPLDRGHNWPSVGNAGNRSYATYQEMSLDDLDITVIELPDKHEIAQWFSPIILGEIDALVINTQTGLLMYDAQTHELISTYTTGYQVTGTPAVSEKALVMLAGSSGNLYLFDLSENWISPLWEELSGVDNPYFSRPVVDDSGSPVGFIGDNMGNVIALDLAKLSFAESLLWEIRLDSSVYTALMLSEDAVLIVTRYGGLYKLDKETGEVRWQFELPVGTTSYSSPTIDEEQGLVYFGRNCGETPATGECGEVFAIDVEKGEKVCSLEIEGGDVRSPVTIGNNGVYFSNAMTGELFKMDKETCEVIWQVQPTNSGPVGDTTAVLVENENGENILILRNQENRAYLLVVDADTGESVSSYQLLEGPFFFFNDPGKSYAGIAVANDQIAINGGPVIVLK
ncbi:MAG: PQQ-binding-like beta-propeller repeat protein [Candidatus Margulisbacteria bacterium]|nr:PQQ-binding-like beta-propeller repeat protein [Candidatus Margulisiibacteriota bacterium]